MNNFFRGILFGVGIGLLVAPMKGEDFRRLLSQRASELRASLPENDQLNAYRQQITDRVSQTTDTLKGYAQQAADTVKSSAGNLGDIAQNASSTAKSSGQDIANTTKDAANSAKSNSNSNL